MRVSNRCCLLSLLVAALALPACGDPLVQLVEDPAHPDDPDAAPPPDAAATFPDASLTVCEGQADGTSCGDATDGDCDAADSCQGGVCVTNVAADGAACGDPGADDCDAADTCNAGVCASNNADDGAACGDPTDTDCDAADSCSAGLCATNDAGDGDACGDPTDTECDDPDTCSTGLCAGNLATDGDPCGSVADTECDDPDTCASGACATNGEVDGIICYDCAGGPGQCATCTAAECDEVTCVLAGAEVLSAPSPHGNGNAGFMFDIQATNTVIITSFDVFPIGVITGLEIYAKTGTHVGFESTAGAWTLLGSSAGVAPDGTAPVPVPIAVNTTISAGTTTAFYVTATGGASVTYHNGTSRATVAASDANITLFEGTGKAYPFTSSNITRAFEGNIHYTTQLVSEALDSSTGTATGVDVDSAMFDVVATNAVEEADTLSVELAAGTFDVDVYFRRGTHVGFEGSAAGWQFLASEAGVVSAGGGALSDILLASPVDIDAGDTAAFYVDTGAAEAGLQTDPGGAVGDPAASTADQTMLVGRALGGGFGAAGAPTIFRGSLNYGECLLTVAAPP